MTSKTPNQILFDDLRPKRGAPLYEPLMTARRHLQEIGRLEALLVERQTQLEAVRDEARQAKTVTADSDPLAGTDADARVIRLQAIVNEAENALARERTALARPRNQAQELWAQLTALERRYLVYHDQAEQIEPGHVRDVAAGNAARCLAELEALYKEYTGRAFKAGACGAVARWEPAPPILYDELQKAAVKLSQQAAPVRWKEDGDLRSASTAFAQVVAWDDEKRREMQRQIDALHGRRR